MMELLLTILVFAVIVPALTRSAQRKGVPPVRRAPTQVPRADAPTPRTSPRRMPAERHTTPARPSVVKTTVPSSPAWDMSFDEGGSAIDYDMIRDTDETSPVRIPGLTLSFDRNSVLQGIVYAEILGKPGGKRSRRRDI